MPSPSPPKPWEKAAATKTTITTQLPGTNSSFTQNPTADTAPALPARPSTTNSTFTRGYNSYNTSYNTPYSNYGTYGSTYGSPYNRYGSYSSYSSSYSPYNRYGYGTYGGYGGGSYASYSPFNRFNTHGGMMGPNGPNGPDDLSLTQRMEANTAAGFQMIESIVNAFGGFAQMLESTYFATHSSFMAMVGVVEQFGNLRNYLGQVLSIFTLIRWIRQLFYKITGRRPPVDPQELNPVQFEQFQERKFSRRPLIFFILAVFGVPYLMHKFIQVISRRRQEISANPQQGGSQLIIPEQPTPGFAQNAQNLEFCRALYDFRGESSMELSLKRGDFIAILSKNDMFGQPSQWWRGRLRNGEQGMFPSNYVEIINKGGGGSEVTESVEELKIN
ncbi:37759_t:CDS:2 [Gigaspora margarita]|uniref:37759_t:CDS:1 n=2 Tax=Gigaspora margarita TaxID=4874 RepID=A0ABN7WJD3_GIGMA|nr:Peroxin 13, N-terminal region-domain-containing protein [Gigaspora margarita]CAG8833526.1 37759_t:CDS:2 [Gigaspora margarita]